MMSEMNWNFQCENKNVLIMTHKNGLSETGFQLNLHMRYKNKINKMSGNTNKTL